MGGHVLTGKGKGTGITVSAASGDIDVENGTVTGFPVGLRLVGATGVSLVNVTATANGRAWCSTMPATARSPTS